MGANRGGGGYTLQLPVMSPMVKYLILVNVTIWVVGQLLLDQYIFNAPWITTFLSLTPQLFIEKFLVWQPFTYMFLHDEKIFHILFNMISLWFFGSELEHRWGGRPFLQYYLMTGLGAALLYVFGVAIYGIIKGTVSPVYGAPVIGASGAVFGILVAYGVLFGERVIYFFGVFPMKARFFVLLLAGMEFVALMNVGPSGSRVANLAHIGGMISGLIYLWLWTKKLQSRGGKARKKAKGRRGLRLVVDNEKDKKPGEDPNDPRYWN